MLAMAKCAWEGSCADFQVKTKSTAYSGSTAISASSATASDSEMSISAASAAHERMKAAPKMAIPKTIAPDYG